ncbi:unnamed protein product [Rhizopus stolonifer]
MYVKRHKTIQNNTLKNYFEASNEVRKQEIEELRSHHVFDNGVVLEVEGLDLVENGDITWKPTMCTGISQYKTTFFKESRKIRNLALPPYMQHTDCGLRGNQRYYSDVIRFWAKEYIINSRLPVFRQGQHAKSELILADKDVASFVKKYILEMKASLYSLSIMSRHINLNVVSEFMNNQLGTVFPSTLSKYLKLWRFTFKIRGKSI